MIDFQQAGSVTALISVLWPIFRIIERKIPMPRSNVRGELDGFETRIKKIEGNLIERSTVERLDARIGYVEDDIARLQRGRFHD